VFQSRVGFSETAVVPGVPLAVKACALINLKWYRPGVYVIVSLLTR